MTICIGSLCENRNAIVFAADRMLTAGFLALEFEHEERKIEEIGDFCVLMSSGNALISYELIEQLRKEIPKTTGEIADKLYELQTALSLKRAEQLILIPRGLSWQTYREKGGDINPQLYMILDEELTKFSFKTDFLVLGIDDKGGHVISLEFPGIVQHFDKVGFGAIGSGVPHATVSLCLDRQTQKRPLAETLYAVYVSKRKAEYAPGVGKDTDMGVITRSGIKFLTEKDLQSLDLLYNKERKKSVDLSELGKISERILAKT
jgi:20S proteasome alpha/beta subunit